MSQADNVGVVRMLSAAARENDVDALLSLTTPDVDRRPTAVAGAWPARLLQAYELLFWDMLAEGIR